MPHPTAILGTEHMMFFERESLGIWTTKTPRKTLCLGAFVVPFDQSLLSPIANQFAGFSLSHRFYHGVLYGNTFSGAITGNCPAMNRGTFIKNPSLTGS